MRIGYLVSLYPASSHTFVRREVHALREQGVDVRTFSVRTPRSAERSAPEDRRAFEETCYLLPMAPLRLLRAHLATFSKNPLGYMRTLRLSLQHRVPGVRALCLSFAYFAEAMVLARELEQRGITHLHNHFANAGANVGFLAARYLGIPWSLTLHGHSETDYPAGNLLPQKLVAADFAVCISYFGRAQAYRVIAPEHWEKLFISRCGVDLQALPVRDAAITRELNARRARGGVRLICVARLAAEKGIVGLLQAFAKARVPGVELVLVGEGPERKSVEQYIEQLGISDQVQLRGRLPESETLREIALADVLVLASFLEGLPVVLMEAMALCVPVVAPRIAGVPELVEDGHSGLLFPASAWDELAECLRRITTDHALRGKLAGAGRAKIEREFDIRRAVRPLLARYRAAETTQVDDTLAEQPDSQNHCAQGVRV